MTQIYYLFATPILYVQFALVLFFSVFISVLVRESTRPRREITHLAALPLEDDAVTNDQEVPQ